METLDISLLFPAVDAIKAYMAEHNIEDRLLIVDLEARAAYEKAVADGTQEEDEGPDEEFDYELERLQEEYPGLACRFAIFSLSEGLRAIVDKTPGIASATGPKYTHGAKRRIAAFAAEHFVGTWVIEEMRDEELTFRMEGTPATITIPTKLIGIEWYEVPQQWRIIPQPRPHKA